MVTLVLVRHAKSDWGDPGLADHDRPLNERGLRDAPAMAERVAESGVHPEVVLSSTAVRARATAVVFADRFGVPVRFEPQLYGAAPKAIVAHAASAGAACVMVVAHDPGISALAGHLAAQPLAMPTCAVAAFAWSARTWDRIILEEPEWWTFDSPRGPRRGLARDGDEPAAGTDGDRDGR